MLHRMRGLLVRGGAVLTGDPSRPVVQALAVRGGTVIALGPGAAEAAGADAEVLDLAGGCAVPGFRDGHVHPLWGGVDMVAAPLSDATTLDGLVEAVRAFAAAHPELTWVTGGGYVSALAPGGRFDATWLDAAVPDRPAVLLANDYHTAWANSRALALAGIDRSTPDPPRGQIVRHADGSPQGTLRESAVELVTRLLPVPTVQDRRAGLERAAAMLAGHGIVHVQEAALEPEDLDVYLALAAEGRLPLSVSVALRVDPTRWRDQREQFAAARARAAQDPSGQVRVRTVKLFADGVVEAGTASMLEAYEPLGPAGCTHASGNHGGDEDGGHGLANWTDAELAEVVTAFDADGFQVHVHAIGDAAVRASLDAVEAAQRAHGPGDRRPVIAHTQVVHPRDLPRFAALGVVANFEPLWAQQDPVMVELTEPRLGPQRSLQQYPMAAVLGTGARVSFGSDWPVTGAAPLAGIATAVTRQTPEGQPAGGWLPEQRLPLSAALAAYTSGTAWQCFDDHAGRLVEGAPADLVALGADLTRVNGHEIADVPVLSTWRRGERTTP